MVARFDAAVSHHARIAAARCQTLVVGTHGLAPTVWLASRLCLHPTPEAFWAGVAFPDLIDVDLGAGLEAVMPGQQTHSGAELPSGACAAFPRPD
ncbi:hypothetical protein [Streptomyces sp. FIT100]|uniref:hypothetical protein n=1 Tax=Streptomyces sp. FIT100 TaxID=2837956 RepID=UPI0021C5F30A|nr:hypothetical protein [Streptomyces sp. FIT100]UUN27658.1 hypothetical protein KK483_15555 [Streptomyces sp. FIT100]